MNDYTSGGGLFDLNFGNDSSLNSFGNLYDFGNTTNGNYNDFTGSGLSNFNPSNFSNNSQSLDNYSFDQPTMPTLNMNGQSDSFFNSLFGNQSQGGPWTNNLGGTETDYIPEQTQTNSEGWNLGGIKDYLSKLFNNPQAIAGLIGAFSEGNQNKQAAKSTQQIVQAQQAQQQLQRQQAIERQNQQQQVVSPFDRASVAAGGDSMRNAMQKQLMSAVQNPYDVPLVKQQVEALTEAQRRKDAAAGRRSNDATSNPQLLAEQAKIAQNYINSMQGPAGATINPNYPGLNSNTEVQNALQALLSGNRYNVNGYTSPLLNALGFSQTR